MDLSSTDALIIVDMQNDYCSDGSVPVAGAAALVKTLSDLSRRVMSRGRRVQVTQDWHCDKHLSFSENGGTWPQHFVQGTKGAGLHSELNLPVGSLVKRKGTDRRIEARSAFTESKLLETLQRFSVERVYICGVPTELTVLETALEANSLGFTTFAVEDGIAALTQDAAEVAGAVEKMKDAGIELISRDELAG